MRAHDFLQQAFGARRVRLPSLAARVQRGSVVVSAAIALSALLIVLIGTELGYLFFMHREFQKGADLSAMAGAQAVEVDNCAPARQAALANATLNMPAGDPVTAAEVQCGHWNETTLAFAADTQPFNAVRVAISRTPALLMPALPGNAARAVSVQATAAQRHPQAALNIRSTLATVDTANSPLLNAVVGGLLGGNVSVSAAGWQGLVDTNVNLLTYLDQLAIALDVDAGNYDEVLQTEASVGTLLAAMATALQQGGSTAQVAVDALGLIVASANAASAQPLIKLGDLLGVQTGTPAAGLGVDLQVFQVLQGVVQLANGSGAVVANLPVNVPGVGAASVRLKVIEGPQVSGIGNPMLAALDPDGPNAIATRTAQFRALVTLEVPLLSTVSGLLNAVTQLLTPVTTLLNNVLTLNLQAIVGSILCFDCTQTRVVLVPEPVRVSIYVDAPATRATITDVDCTASARSLDVRTNTSLASLRVGQMTPAAEAAALANGPIPPIGPIPLMDTETRQCTTIIFTSCGSWTKYSRTGLMADTTVGATQNTLNYASPPEIGQPPAYQPVSATDIISSLSDTLSGLQLQTYRYVAGGNHLGALIGNATALVQAALSAVSAVVDALLAPVLDQLVNVLLSGLGIQLSQANVGAQLSCTRGVELVF